MKTTPAATQANPLPDNFEALAPGPLLHDVRQSLVSDDNFNRSQTTRVIVLAVARDLL